MTRPYATIRKRDRELDAAQMAAYYGGGEEDPSPSPGSPEDASASTASTGDAAGVHLVRLDALAPGDRFRWAGCSFEIADESPFEHLDRPYQRVIYRETCGGIAGNGDTGIMPCAETVEPMNPSARNTK